MKKQNFKTTIFFLILFLAVSFDRLLKILAVNDSFYPPIKLLGEVFQLNFAANKYISFSLPFSGTGLIVLIIIILIWLAYYLVYNLRKEELKKAGLVLLIMFGAVSNLFDRFKYGYVVDYLDLKYFTVFNLADAMIVVGTIFLVWLLTKSSSPKVREDKKTV